MGKEKTSWDTESGLLDNFDFVVEEQWFGEDENSDDGRIFLFLQGTATDDMDEVTEDHVERYSTGKNWEVVEDGEEVENATGRNRFNQNSGMGRFINALVALGDDVAEMLQERGEANVAATFANLNMHMENRVVSTWPDKETNEQLEWRLNLPTSISIKKKKAKKASPKKASSKKASPKKGGSKGGSSKLRNAIIEFAAQFDEDEHSDFVEQILDEDVFSDADKIEADEELNAEVLDSDSKLWAKAHK